MVCDIPEVNEIIDKCISEFDPNAQDLILIGEMSELTSALLNKRRGREDKANVTEELCHVLISAEVVRRLLGISIEDIQAEANRKLEKLQNGTNKIKGDGT